jgi:hypothetical protein
MNAAFTLKRLVFATVALIALAVAFVGFQLYTAKGSLSSILGFSSSKGALASASCDLPAVGSLQDEVYFVSCGGFF